MARRKVCVVVASRANYGSIKSAMQAIRNHPELELQVVAGASALLDRFGEAVKVLEDDGFRPDARVHMIIEGETTLTMAKSTALGLLELPTIFGTLEPDIVVTVADRFETMATAIAAAYMNIPLAHTQGGEISGSIDESVRHAVTKLAHLHFPANAAAGERIVRMGEDPAAVHVVGCPRIDVAAEVIRSNGGLLDRDLLERQGVGGHVDIDEPFLLAAQYPVTTEFGRGEDQVEETLMALRELALPTIMLWPNVDAGSEDVAQGMRKFRERHEHEHIRFYKNFPVETWLSLMERCACIVGNTSSSLREGAFFGTPAVNIGTRQRGRDRGPNITDVDHDRRAIVEAVRAQIEARRYPSSDLYGDGRAGPRIAEILAGASVEIQKKLAY